MAPVLRSGKIYVQVALEPSVIERIDAAAKFSGLSRSKFCAELIKDSLSEADLFAQVLQSPGVYRALKKTFTDPDVVGAITGAEGPVSPEAQGQLMVKFTEEIREAVKSDVRKTKAKPKGKSRR